MSPFALPPCLLIFAFSVPSVTRHPATLSSCHLVTHRQLQRLAEGDRALLFKQRQLLDDPPRYVLNGDLLFFQLGQLGVPAAHKQVEAIDYLAAGQADALGLQADLAHMVLAAGVNTAGN